MQAHICCLCGMFSTIDMLIVGRVDRDAWSTVSHASLTTCLSWMGKIGSVERKHSGWPSFMYMFIRACVANFNDTRTWHGNQSQPTLKSSTSTTKVNIANNIWDMGMWHSSSVSYSLQFFIWTETEWTYGPFELLRVCGCYSTPPVGFLFYFLGDRNISIDDYYCLLLLVCCCSVEFVWMTLLISCFWWSYLFRCIAFAVVSFVS